MNGMPGRPRRPERLKATAKGEALRKGGCMLPSPEGAK
jgi:hypothetical protein